MASSGTLLGSSRQVGQYSTSTARIRVEWQLSGQNVAGNYSAINWQAYMDFFNCDAQLDNGDVGSNAGALWDNSGRVYNYTGNFSTKVIALSSGSFNAGHSSNGTKSLSFSAAIAIFESGTSSGSQSWTLPTINRYASVSSFSTNTITDVSFKTYVAVTPTCNILQYSLDGGGWITVQSSNFTSKTFTISNLKSDTTYSIKVRCRRADSGLYTTSGTITAKTLLQNKYFDTMGL